VQAKQDAMNDQKAKSEEIQKQAVAAAANAVGVYNEAKKIDNEVSTKSLKEIEMLDSIVTMVHTLNGKQSDGDGPSCLAIFQRAQAAGKSVSDGLYTIKPTEASTPFKVYCDMQNGGYTLVATVANGDAQQWTFNAADGDRGQLSSLWENGLTLGTVSADTPTTNADFKSEAFNSLKGSSIMIKYKNTFLLSTNSGCISDSLRNTLNSYKFDCAGSEALNGPSSTCGHSCPIGRSEVINEPVLTHGNRVSFLYVKAGEREGAQDGNKDRAYFSTNIRSNVDYAEGLGSFCRQSQDRSNDMGVKNDDSVRPSDTSIFYTIWVQ